MVVIGRTSVDTQPRSAHQVDVILPGKLSSHPALVVIIPAYNESRFIGSIILQARRFANQVIVIDDGSTDDTAWIARSAGASVVCHESNQGKGAALNTGFHAARQCDPQVVVCLDGDGQHFPDEIDLLIEPIITQQADIVVGSRYLGTTDLTPRHRVWGHRFFNFLTHFASGVESSDSQSGFRAFSPRALQALSFCSQDFSVESEMQFLAQEHDLQLVEMPVTIRYPDPPKRSVLMHGMSVLNGVLSLAGQYRPLLFFGIVGTAQILLGLMLGYRVVYLFGLNSGLAAGTAMLSILFVITGTLSLSTGFILHSIRVLLLELFRRNASR